MTLKNLIKLTATLLQMDSFVASTYFNAGGTTTNADYLRAISTLTTSFNLVNNTIATEYIPLINEKTCSVSDNKLNYTIIDNIKDIMNIKRVRNSLGDSLQFTCFPSYIKVSAESVVVTYSYYPEEIIGVDTEIDTFGIQVSPRVYAYGMAAEYCFINGMYDEAAMWDNRFKDALKGIVKRVTEVKLPTRNWA